MNLRFEIDGPDVNVREALLARAEQLTTANNLITFGNVAPALMQATPSSYQMHVLRAMLGLDDPEATVIATKFDSWGAEVYTVTAALNQATAEFRASGLIMDTSQQGQGKLH